MLLSIFVISCYKEMHSKLYILVAELDYTVANVFEIATAQKSAAMAALFNDIYLRKCYLPLRQCYTSGDLILIL